MIYDANPQLAALDLGEQRRVTWTNAAGEEVDGVVILPPGYRKERRYPVIVNPYPLCARDYFWLSPRYEATGQLEAARGYVIFRPGLRAPHAAYCFPRGENYTEKARGVAGIPIMVDDFTSGVEFLVRGGIVDQNRVGLFGHSNGGWETNLLITETSVANAAVISSGVSNAVMMSFFPLPMITRGTDPATGGNVFDDFESYVRLSPIFKMRNIEIPVLLTVGDQDWFWVPQMIAEYGVLRSEGKDVQLIRYSNEEHSLVNRQTIEDALARMNSFFDAHLRDGDVPIGNVSLQ
jgi:dipeptidyl aminopeptidase/acylaminoacyl peptidase